MISTDVSEKYISMQSYGKCIRVRAITNFSKKSNERLVGVLQIFNNNKWTKYNEALESKSKYNYLENNLINKNFVNHTLKWDGIIVYVA